MHDVLRTHSLSHAMSIKAALELEGIPATLFNENALGYMNLAGEIRVMVPDVEGDRARALIQTLEPPQPVKRPITRAWRWERRGLRLIGLAVALYALRVMAQGYIPQRSEGAVLVVVLALGGLGALLLLVGLFFLEEKPRSPWSEESADGSDAPASTRQ
jgi:Putative prokaryotic signal transducing protein